jgi:PAS domain S-box-containing protein
LKRPRTRASRRASDEALARSEARFRALTHLTSDWYWEQDAEYRFTQFSSDHASKGRIDESALLGKRRWEVSAIRLSPQAWAAHRADLDARRPFRNFEYQVQGASGRTHWMSTSGEPMFDPAGRFLGYRGVVREITERKLAEAALAQSEARFRSIVESGSDWIWETDTEDRYVWFGGDIERHVGRPTADYIGRTRSEVAAAGGVDVNAEPWLSHMAAIARREPFRDLRQCRDTPMGKFWISVSGAPRFDAEGRFLGYRAAVSNITEQVQAEQRTQEFGARLSAAIEHLNESIAITDAEDRIIVANRYFRELNGGTRLVEPGHRYEEHLRAGIPLGNYPEAVGREEAWLEERLARRRRGGAFEIKRQDGKWLLVTDQRLPDGGMVSFALDITERKRMEEELRASLDETDAIFRTSTVGIMLVRERIFVRCNARLEEIFGYGPGELTGKPTRMLYVSEMEWRRAGAEIYPAMEAGRIGHSLIAGLHKTGSQIWVVLTGKFIDPQRPDLGAVFSATDITERKEAEEALRQSEERFRSLADLSSDWYWEQDTELRFISTSGHESGRGGISAADHTGKKRWELPGTGIEGSTWDEHRATLAARQPFRDLLLKRTASDGAVHYVSVSGEPMFDAQGAFAGYRGIARDITERIVAEKQARAADERLRQAIDDLNESIALTDHEDRIVLTNKRFRENNEEVAQYILPGCHFEDHLRARIRLGHFPEAAGREAEWLEERRVQRRNPTGAIERQRHDGTWLRITDQRLPDGGTITYGLDITARKRAEEAMSNINADLEHRVAERTAALETAYRELESFSYSVSHDLRSPLGVIASFAGILGRQENGRISEDGMRLVTVIDENAQRMGRLIDALLELMRMSRRALAFNPLDMARIAGSACRELQRAYPNARIELGELPPAQGDEMLVQQIYANLVGNALKFSSKTASPRVEVGAEAGAGPQQGLPVYFVRDNGAGFDTEYATKLFKPFERLHSEAEFPGTGIGLALVNLIVQRHGGRIWAESAPGKGSTFRFTLAQQGPDTLSGGAPG